MARAANAVACRPQPARPRYRQDADEREAGEFASTSSSLSLITLGTSELLVTLCDLRNHEAPNASGYRRHSRARARHEEAQHGPGPPCRGEHQTAAAAGPVDQRPEYGRDHRERRDVKRRYRITFGRAWLVVALKNKVSASETVTNTSPATPIA